MTLIIIARLYFFVILMFNTVCPVAENYLIFFDLFSDLYSSQLMLFIAAWEDDEYDIFHETFQ